MVNPDKSAPEVRGPHGKVVAARGAVVSGHVLLVLIVSLFLALIAVGTVTSYFRADRPSESTPAGPPR
jgi:hypothetical protein